MASARLGNSRGSCRLPFFDNAIVNDLTNSEHLFSQSIPLPEIIYQAALDGPARHMKLFSTRRSRLIATLGTSFAL
jgi:hypothetical protein